jgi:GTP pyrophosphokinase
MQNIAQKCNYQNVEDLLAGLGYGEVTALQVANRLREANKVSQAMENNPQDYISPEVLNDQISGKQVNTLESKKFPIAGIEGLMHHLAGCCRPIPGEPIMGVVTTFKGISIHHQSCPNLQNMSGDRLIPVRWNATNQKSQYQTYPVDIVIETIDRVGIFKDILARLSDQNINVSNAGVKTTSGKPALISLTIDIKDSEQFKYIINQIKNMSDVLNIRRISEINR